MRRIVMDARYGLRSPRRGIGEYVYQLVRHLADIPQRPYELVLLGDGSAHAEVVAELGVAFAVQILKAPNFALWEQWQWPRAARRDGADLVHGTANIGPIGWRGPLLLTVLDVIEWHRGKDFPSRIAPRHHLSRAYRMQALRAQVQRAQAILTISDFAKADIAQMLKVPSARIHVTPLAAKHLGEPGGFPKQPYFLSLGALDPRKNFATVLKALALTADPAIRLWAPGFEENALPAAQALAQQLGVASRVDFQAMVSDAELWEAYRHARGFLYLSFSEGFGLPLLEAMGLGCPVIASRTSSLPEVGGDVPLWVDPRDAREAARAMDQLWVEGPLAKTMAARGIARQRQFSWQRTAELTHAVYCEVLGA